MRTPLRAAAKAVGACIGCLAFVAPTLGATSNPVKGEVRWPASARNAMEDDAAQAQPPELREADELLAKGAAAQAISAYQRALAKDPANTLARFGLTRALYQTGAYSLAWDSASKAVKLFTPALVAELRHRAAVELLRQAQASEDDTKASLLSKSIALMEANGPLGFIDVPRASDLVVAYFEAEQYEQAIALFEATNSSSKDGAAAWARLPAAKSYVRLGRLADARKLLESLHAVAPDDVPTAYALVFVYSDLHRFSDAQSVLERLCEGLRIRKDPELAYALQLKARLLLWAGDRASARKATAVALSAFPSSAALKRLQADIDRDGGRLTAAREQLLVLSRMDSEDVEARVTLATLGSDEDPGRAEAELRQLGEELGGNTAVQRALAEVRKSRAPRVRVQMTSSADRDSKGQELVARATGPAWGDSATRVFVEASNVRDQLKEGDVVRRSQSVGVESSLGSFGTVEAAVVQQPVAGTGLSLAWSAAPADGWWVHAGYKSLDTDVAARAFTAGVTSSSYSLGARYVADGLSVSLDARSQSLTDNNVRNSVSAAVAGKLPAWGNVRPDWTIRAGAETASNTQVSYFSPQRSWWTDWQLGAALPKVRILGTDTYASIKPAVSLGSFTQVGFGTLLTASAELGTSIDLTANTSLGLSASVVHRPYDGKYVTQQHGNLVLSTKLP